MYQNVGTGGRIFCLNLQGPTGHWLFKNIGNSFSVDTAAKRRIFEHSFHILSGFKYFRPHVNASSPRVHTKVKQMFMLAV